MTEEKKETLTKFGIPLGGKGRGVLMPLQKYRFRVIFERDLNVYDVNEGFFLTQFVEDVIFDSLNNRVKINLRQSVIAEQVNAVFDLVHSNGNIFVEGMDGAHKALFTIVLSHCKCISHGFGFTYKESDPVMHELVFEYTSLNSRNPIDWEKRIGGYFTEKDFFKDEEFPSPQEALKRYEEELKARAAKDTESQS